MSDGACDLFPFEDIALKREQFSNIADFSNGMLKILEEACDPETNAYVHHDNMTLIAARLETPSEQEEVISYAEGIDWENDKPRVFPELLEMALEFVSLLVLLKEEADITHGDIAPSNIRIGDDGTISLIDFDGYISQNLNILDPMTIGQRPMQAPELRIRTGVIPDFDSDHFAMALQLSIILLGLNLIGIPMVGNFQLRLWEKSSKISLMMLLA